MRKTPRYFLLASCVVQMYLFSIQSVRFNTIRTSQSGADNSPLRDAQWRAVIVMAIYMIGVTFYLPCVLNNITTQGCIFICLIVNAELFQYYKHQMF